MNTKAEYFNSEKLFSPLSGKIMNFKFWINLILILDNKYHEPRQISGEV